MCATRPKDKKELFNLQHSSLQNVIEHIFGILKHHFCILLIGPEYDFEIQARIPAALATLHNFIQLHTPDTQENNKDDINGEADENGLYIIDCSGVPDPVDEDDHMKVLWEKIAQEMWNDYQHLIREQYGEDQVADDDDSEDDNIEDE